MGNHCSSGGHADKYIVAQSLWKSERAIPVSIINPNLEALRVLDRHSDGYHDAGNVLSLCKSGSHKEWLEAHCKVHLRRRKANNRHHTPVIFDDDGDLASALVGPANATAWFGNLESMQICIPDWEIREYKSEKWQEMVRHFRPNLKTPTLTGPRPGIRDGKRELFVVQKVGLVSHIKITAYYRADAGVVNSAPPVSPSPGVKAEASFRNTSTGVVGEFVLSATRTNRKLPVAFSGFVYKYDKFGNLEERESRSEADADHEDVDEDDEEDDEGEDEDEEDDNPQNDPNYYDFLEDGDLFVTVRPMDPRHLEIMPYLDEDAPAGEDEGDEEDDGDVDRNIASP